MNAEELLALDDLPRETFVVPIWGEVTIRALNGEQREELENLISSFKAGKGSKKSVRATAAVFSIVDASSGEPVFKPSHAEALGKKSGLALDAVWDRVIKLNALGKGEAEAIAGN